MPEHGGLPGLDHGAVITVGTFDGIHRGHRDILARLCARAAARKLPPVLITFRPHPIEVVKPGLGPMLLTPDDEQLDALADSGPLSVVVLPFTPTLAQYSARAFVTTLLVERYHVRELVVGYDHGFGRGKEGDASVLAKLGAQLGFDVDVMPATLDADETAISSRAIRAAIAEGNLARAQRFLGRPYSFRGSVVPGAQRGRDLGYPTLNIEIPSPRKLLPPEGVYAVRAQSSRGEFGGMMNLGARPTFGEFDRTLEIHLFDATGDWYGEAVSVQFVRHLRDTRKFDGISALVTQLGQDAADARIALTQA